MKSKKILTVVMVILIFTLISSLLIGFNTNTAQSKKNVLKHTPRNIIVLISDGAGFNHVDAASLYQYGDIGMQVYESFSVQLAMATFMAGSEYDPDLAWHEFDYVINNSTDSAAAATAISTGKKTYNGAIGVDLNGEPIMHLMERAEEIGKATGVVTSVEWSHATPAGFVAHKQNRRDYTEIAQEMVFHSAADVIMGSGHPWYDNNGNLKTTPNTYKYVGGESTWDGLVAGLVGGDADADGVDDPWTLIQTLEEFQALMNGNTPKRVIGVAPVFQTLQQKRSGNQYADPYIVPFNETVPSLKEMTKAALNILDNDPDGFFLMVEGGAIDWASHPNQSGRMIEEEIEFNMTVETIVTWVRENSNWGETLVIVTGDHETGYLTGPGSGMTANGPVWNSLINNGPGRLPGMVWHRGGHTNSLIPFYAKGRGANFFRKHAETIDPVRGKYIDNTDIANILFSLLVVEKRKFIAGGDNVMAPSSPVSSSPTVTRPESDDAIEENSKAATYSASDLNEGKQWYDDYCVDCHGTTLKGDGVNAPYLIAKPGDLTTSKKTNEELFKVIKEGGEAVGLSDSMPAWASLLEDQDIWKVIAWVTSNQKSRNEGSKLLDLRGD